MRLCQLEDMRTLQFSTRALIPDSVSKTQQTSTGIQSKVNKHLSMRCDVCTAHCGDVRAAYDYQN